MISHLDSLFTSTAIVALAEMGDKTQLLSFALAARYRKAVPIVLGILVATLLNHWLAALLGQWLMNVSGHWLTQQQWKWLLAASFIAMAAWLLIPDKLDDLEQPKANQGVFVATVIAFFLAEMGDKTQVATVLLAAQSNAVAAVVVGTTLGMMIANVPAVLLGERLSRKLTDPRKLAWVHRMAALIFVGVAAAIVML